MLYVSIDQSVNKIKTYINTGWGKRKDAGCLDFDRNESYQISGDGEKGYFVIGLPASQSLDRGFKPYWVITMSVHMAPVFLSTGKRTREWHKYASSIYPNITIIYIFNVLYAAVNSIYHDEIVPCWMFMYGSYT
jgi:hypothetical protein